MKCNDFKRGANSARDYVICVCIGFQNENGNKIESDEYKAYQNIIGKMEKEYGKFMSS